MKTILLNDEDSLLPSIPFVPDLMNSPNLAHLLQVSDDAIHRIATLTTGQRSNVNWHRTRVGRLTGSVLGDILNFLDKHPNSTSLSKTLRSKLFNPPSHGQALVYGNHHEADGVLSFKTRFRTDVAETGIWLHPKGWLGSSPDGLVGLDGVLEIKCPFSWRELDVRVALRNTRIGPLTTVDGKGKPISLPIARNSDGKLYLIPNHNYYHQVQAHLLVTGRQHCFFFIWTPKGSLMVKVEVDNTWREANIKRLEHFYFNIYLDAFKAHYSQYVH